MQGKAVVYDTKELQYHFDNVMALLSQAESRIDNKKPSEWVEENIVLSSSMSEVKGPFRYRNNPPTREIIDQLDRSSPVKEVAVMKSGQSGVTKGVLLPGLVWGIKNDPGMAMLLVARDDLLEATVTDIDVMLEVSGVKKLLQPLSKRARNTKSGDTDTKKEFPGGSLLLRKLHPNSLRQVSIRTMMADDVDAFQSDSKKDGDIDTLIDKRTNTYKNSKKIYKISTPTIKGKSNIERAFERGDKRKYNVPCPLCNKFIVLEWRVKSNKNPANMCGITWLVDEDGRLIPESVGYLCQECEGFFNDSDKMSWLNAGVWKPTAIPKIPGVISYHFSGLYAPYFADGWLEFVYQWIAIEDEPSKAKRETARQAFTNLVLGYPYEKRKITVSASIIQENIRPYDILTLPEKLSIEEGNGKIILVTCGMDLNGKENDARVDYEIVAWSEGGQSYSVDHSSFGTFIPRDKNPDIRAKKTYRHGVPDSVWPHVEKLINTKIINDNTNKKMPIFLSTIDTGYMTEYAYSFIDTHNRVVGVKGDDDAEDDAISEFNKLAGVGVDMKTYKKALSRDRLYIVNVNYTKDIVHSHMGLLWTRAENESQPFGFMNFPTPSNGKYLHSNFFKHFESEEKRVDKGKYRWVKKQGKQNHMWDCRVYNEVAKDIFVNRFFAKAKVRNGTWSDYVRLIRNALKK